MMRNRFIMRVNGFSVWLFLFAGCVFAQNGLPTTVSTDLCTFGIVTFGGISEIVIKNEAQTLTDALAKGIMKWPKGITNEEKISVLKKIWIEFRRITPTGQLSIEKVAQMGRRYGWLTVNSKPRGAKITLNGIIQDGTTKLGPVGKEAKKYEIKLEKVGYLAATGTVELMAERQETFFRRLKKGK